MHLSRAARRVEKVHTREERAMPITTTRRRLLAGSAAALAMPAFARAQGAAKPRLTAISQWSAGSDGAAITALGKKFEEKGGVWQHSPVPGLHHRDDEQAARPDHGRRSAGLSRSSRAPRSPPGRRSPRPSISTPVVAAAGYEKVVAPDLARLHKPGGKWIALPLQIYSTNMLFLSKRAMDKAKADKIPVTWAEFNDACRKDEGGRRHISDRQRRHPPRRWAEIRDRSRRHQSRRHTARAIMNLDKKALKGPEVKAAFAQVRKIADWMDPNVAAQPYAINLQALRRRRHGHDDQGGWAQGVLLNAGFKLDDFIIAPGPSDNGKPVFLLNADAFIFWQRKEPDLQAGQTLMAQLVMDPAIQTMYSQITGSIPGAHRRRSLR